MAPGDSGCDPAAAALEAAVRVLANELPQVPFRVINIPSITQESSTELPILSLVLLSVCGAYVYSSDINGLLDGLAIRRPAPHVLQSNEVSIEVHAAGVNFKDVMNAMGLLAERTVGRSLVGQRLGLEIAGRVLDTDTDVKDLTSGDAVMPRVANGFAGCVGIAAIQLAKRLGAHVFATTRTLQRREILLSLSVKAAFDSRLLDFHDKIMQLTKGRGVDVVLNSLTGQLLLRGIACLAPFCWFVRIGKTDIYRNARRSLERLGDNYSFFVVDVDKLASQHPTRHHQILDKVADMFARGEPTLHPITEYPITDVPSALKTLSRGAVLDKLAITIPAEEDVVTLPPARLYLCADRTYPMKACSGLLCKKTGKAQTSNDVFLLACPFCDWVCQGMGVKGTKAQTSVSALVNRWQHFPPLAGVLRSAGVIDDALAHETTQARFWSIFAPKALSTWHLHQVMQHMQLDFFVMVSSCSSVLGLLGQFSYATANQFLDYLARQQASGKHGLSVNIGVFGDYAGMSRSSADVDKVLNVLTSHGLSRMALPDVLEGLERSMLQGIPQRMITDIDWQQFFKAYPHLLRDGAFRDARHINKGSTEERIDFIADQLRLALSKIVGAEPDRISTTEKIDRYSLDSMTLTQVRSIILREMKLAAPLCGCCKAQLYGTLQRNLWGVTGKLFIDMSRVLRLQTPGHETRRSESALTSISELVAGIVAAILSLIDQPYIFWGHGFGGIVAFEVIRALQRADMPLPHHLVVTGTIAPHLIHIWQRRGVLRFMAEDWSPKYLMAISRQIDSPDFVRSIMPGIRLDMPLLLGYNHELEPQIDVPITGLAARQDEFVYPDEVGAWRELATNFRLVEVDGDHWFINRNHELLRSTLAALAAHYHTITSEGFESDFLAVTLI
ncbi:hypothetical protein BDZ45DRAFT_805690 [Acephala macrosclerotiorum]|nr:hypothetical protein BDZ45DRAFT_805690 [Acephala macrosclerotiorum]